MCSWVHFKYNIYLVCYWNWYCTLYFRYTFGVQITFIFISKAWNTTGTSVEKYSRVTSTEKLLHFTAEVSLRELIHIYIHDSALSTSFTKTAKWLQLCLYTRAIVAHLKASSVSLWSQRQSYSMQEDSTEGILLSEEWTTDAILKAVPSSTGRPQLFGKFQTPVQLHWRFVPFCSYSLWSQVMICWSCMLSHAWRWSAMTPLRQSGFFSDTWACRSLRLRPGDDVVNELKGDAAGL